MPPACRVLSICECVIGYYRLCLLVRRLHAAPDAYRLRGRFIVYVRDDVGLSALGVECIQHRTAIDALAPNIVSGG